MKLNKMPQLCRDAQPGVYVLSGMDPDIALVLANALRRVLLSGMPGCAFSRVSISGALHEYTAIQGVKEDVTEIITNLKGTYIRTNSFFQGEKTAHLDVSGPADVTAKNIVMPCPDISIANPDQHLFTIGKDCSLSLSLVLTCGRGVCLAAGRASCKRSIGDIELDAIYNPVQSVNFRSDNDDLIIEIKTNGSADPDFLLSLSASVIRNHLKLIGDAVQPKDDSLTGVFPLPPCTLPLSADIDTLWVMGLPSKVTKALKNAGINTLEKVMNLSADDVLTLNGFGKARLKLLEDFLDSYGLKWKHHI